VPALALELSFAARRPWVPRRADFLRWAGAALPGTRKACVLSIRIVGARGSRRLNARYRDKDRPTNVLSFAGAGPMPDGQDHLGELVLCAPLIASEARTQGKALRAHWAHLTVHGVLHLHGFDHVRPRDARKMEALEVQILERLKVSDPYI
jgi:probable rRNA maturation factor